MTHPFHPLFGREFELIDYRHCWSEDRVFYLGPDNKVRSLPACWTSAGAVEPFVALSDGRSHLTIADLLALVALVGAATSDGNGDVTDC